MSSKPTIIIPGSEKGVRVDSRLLEERIQKAVKDGHRHLEIIAQGQHGIGGRLWRSGDAPVFLRILGTSGQRVGSMGFPNTVIDVVGPVSDDVGWLNAGAKIIVRGQATNGVGVEGDTSSGIGVHGTAFGGTNGVSFAASRICFRTSFFVSLRSFSNACLSSRL